MNKLILIKTNVNIKQIESIKVGVGGEILSAEVKTIKTISAEQFCQIYLRDNEEFYKLSKAESNVLAVYGILLIIMKIKIGHFQEIRFLQMKNLEILLKLKLTQLLELYVILLLLQ